MFNHFGITSNLCDDSMSNDLLHVCLFKHVVACKFETIQVYLSMLEWFNDEHSQSFELHLYVQTELQCFHAFYFL